MRSGTFTAVGVVLTIAGVIWALQGFGVIGGSFMSGDSVWAIIGPIVGAVGLILAVIGVRRARSASLASPGQSGTRAQPRSRPCAANSAAKPSRPGPAARR
jgi:hypothetical protein